MGEVRKIGVDDIAWADFTSTGGVAVTGLTSESIPHSLGPYIDVLAYGATGDGVTDDTAAIQAAIDAAGGTGATVYFPVGVYIISSTITLKSGGYYLGAGFSGFNVGDSDLGSIGSVLKWAGSSGDSMVNANATYNLMWDGIHLEAGSPSNGVIGIDVDGYSTDMKFQNFNIWHADIGMRFGNGGSTQDVSRIQNFRIYLCNTCIQTLSSNSLNLSSIRDGKLGFYDIGIDIQSGLKGSTLENLAGAAYAPLGSTKTFIYLKDQTVGRIYIKNTQCEGESGYNHIVITEPAAGPVTLDSNIFNRDVVLAGASTTGETVGIGNLYNGGNLSITGNSQVYYSIGDSFIGGSVITDSGSNNIITRLSKRGLNVGGGNDDDNYGGGFNIISQKDAITNPTTQVSNHVVEYVKQVGGVSAKHLLNSDGTTIKLYQQNFIGDPSGGGTVDAEARTVIGLILDLLIANGLMASS